ncbi:MAG: GAP family protein [Mycobacterium sp.]
MMLLLGLSVVPDPVRIATTALLVSRPRPMINLLAYWIGGMASGIAFGVVSLTLLRDFLPGFVHSITSTSATLTGGHTKIVIGVLLLTLAALCAKGLIRQRAQVPVGIPGPPAVAPRRSMPGPISRLLAWFRHALEDGRPWISFVVGLNQGPPLVELFAAISIIEASGAAIGAQLGATVLFTATVFAIIEIPLLSYLVRPAQTEMLMLSMCNWLRAHRRQFISVAAGTSGIFLLVSGMGTM